MQGQSGDETRTLRTLVYLGELERQAAIYNDSFSRAWKIAMQVDGPTKDASWPSLQAALFASIVVQRLLKPGKVRRYAHHSSRDQSQNFAEARGRCLCELLGVGEDAPFFLVSNIRDPFEHVDERLDALMRPDVVGISDWYVSDGTVAITPTPDVTTDGMGYGLRVFFAAGGTLHFDRTTLDMYRLDIAMLELRSAISDVQCDLERKIAGPNIFGAHQFGSIMSDEDTERRLKSWLKYRNLLGANINVRLGS